MSDSVVLLASGVQENVTHVMSGVTPQLLGFHSGTVPLAKQVKGDAVDVSMYSTLRAVLTVSAATNRHGFEDTAALHVALEDAPSEAGPWRLIHQFAPQFGAGAQRVVLGGLDRVIRASWYFADHALPSRTVTDGVSFEFGIEAEAEPETPPSED